MTRRLPQLLLIALLIAGCKRAPQDKEAIRVAIMDHVTKNAGIDMSQINLEVGEVKFSGNDATASASFKPKGSPAQGMNMSYTLERRGEKWFVKGRAAGHGGMGGGMGSPMGSGPDASGAERTGELPSGHPPVNSPGSAPKTDLPPGHPPVNQPAPKK